MEIEVTHRPAYALAVAKLADGETVVGETGSMVSMDAHVQIETSAGDKKDGMMKGLMKGLKRAVAGESFFQNKYTPQGGPGEVTFAPKLVGDIETYQMADNTLFMQSTAYVCSSDGVAIDASWGGAKSFFGAGKGLVMLKATGNGPVAFNAFGAIKVIEVDGEYTVDTGHVVAFEDGLQFKVRKFGGGFKSFIFGGEGLVCSFSGKGRIWIQTRNPQAFGEFVGPKLPMREH